MVTAGEPRRKRRVFWWFFLAVQAVFLVWLITGLITVHTGATRGQLVAGCYHHHWYPLFRSRADCMAHYGHAVQAAGDTGKAIGVGLLVLLWVIVDSFLAAGYGVYKLATR